MNGELSISVILFCPTIQLYADKTAAHNVKANTHTSHHLNIVQSKPTTVDVAVWRTNTTQAGGLLGDQGRALGGQRGPRGDAMGGAALGALRGLRGLGASNLPKKTEKTVAAAKELNGFLQGFVEQVGAC